MHILDFTLGFFSGLIGNIFASAGFEWFRSPNLEVFVGEKTTPRPLPNAPTVKYSFLHLNIANRDKLGLTDTAWGVRAKIVFKEVESGEPLFSIAGRWSGNPEPLIPTNLEGTEGRVNPTTFPLLRKIDILSGETQELDVAIKYSGDAAIYAFSNESYGPPKGRMWLTPEWRIDRKEVLVEVTAYSGNLSTTRLFLLKNPNGSPEEVELVVAKP